MSLPDVHQDNSEFPQWGIEKVGVEGVKVSLSVLRKDGRPFVTVADANLYCDLTAQVRGANMSRFIEVLSEVSALEDQTIIEKVHQILRSVRSRLGSSKAYVKLSFPYLIVKSSPVSGLKSPYPVDVSFEGKLQGDQSEIWMTTGVYYLSLCPCSLELTGGQGAHNQRSCATVSVELGDQMIWIEEIVELVEKHASAPIFSLLKRPDEKWVTEWAMSRPRFVEDMSRLLADELMRWVSEGRIWRFKVRCVHDESIHTHKAVSEVSFGEVW